MGRFKNWLKKEWDDAGAKADAHVSGDAFEGVLIVDGQVTYKGQAVALAGARATVETAGQIERRVTATRLVALGLLAFAAKKKRDSRELYLSVESSDGMLVAAIDPAKGEAARQFAARINTRALG
ncbi:hypothetical protein [Amycolatopsis sp. NPDC059021]|uniref:hypothetical protein n=1 Tax=Amycolatopsis sp. NPDC059021 TaxID=3346704 RepID=UPI00367303EE